MGYNSGFKGLIIQQEATANTTCSFTSVVTLCWTAPLEASHRTFIKTVITGERRVWVTWTRSHKLTPLEAVQILRLRKNCRRHTARRRYDL